jgi:hypothetical protein
MPGPSRNSLASGESGPVQITVMAVAGGGTGGNRLAMNRRCLVKCAVMDMETAPSPSPLDQPRGTPIAREWVGMARAFRDRIADSDKAVPAQIRGFARMARELLKERVRRQAKSNKPNLVMRKEHLIGLEHVWRGLPGIGRLGFESEITKDRSIISDVRLRPVTTADPDWQDGGAELALSVIDNRFQIGGGKMDFQPITLAVVSLHALARRYQRGFTNDDGAILHDLRMIALAAPAFVSGKGGDICIPAGDGNWFGEGATVGVKVPVLSVRTYHAF